MTHNLAIIKFCGQESMWFLKKIVPLRRSQAFCTGVTGTTPLPGLSEQEETMQHGLCVSACTDFSVMMSQHSASNQNV